MDATPEQLLAMMPHAAGIGVRLEKAEPEEVRGSLPWAAERCTAGGVLHGGALMALADSVGAVCAFLNLPEGAGTSTVDSSTRFFRGVRGGTVHAVARVVHAGRTLITVETDLTDDQKRLVARTAQTQIVLG
ncbi:PaaI family thioesterase [Phaeacidiphilus oryzae]|uniref:PaaI family thioesterase n=1 Tax=Phaeacidiphilus oryzae TaxID=348818 RepID=UPI000565BE51|nr:PaaI family thioesterase [Phaeacidiphilus oryzae]